MAYLTFNNEQDAQASIDAVNAVYGCPYVLDNSYRMNQWDVVTKSDAENKWGFSEPKARPNKEKGRLNAALRAGHSKTDKRPDGWKNKNK